jgi:hypothetical protein
VSLDPTFVAPGLCNPDRGGIACNDTAAVRYANGAALVAFGGLTSAAVAFRSVAVRRTSARTVT